MTKMSWVVKTIKPTDRSILRINVLYWRNVFIQMTRMYLQYRGVCKVSKLNFMEITVLIFSYTLKIFQFNLRGWSIFRHVLCRMIAFNSGCVKIMVYHKVLRAWPWVLRQFWSTWDATTETWLHKVMFWMFKMWGVL